MDSRTAAFTPFGKSAGPSSTPGPLSFAFGPSGSSLPTSGSSTPQALPPVAFQSPSPAVGQPLRPDGIQRSPELVDGTPSPLSTFQHPNFSTVSHQSPGAQSGRESLVGFKSPNFVNQHAPRPNEAAGIQGSRPSLKDHGEQSVATSPGASFVLSRRFGTDAAEIGRSQDPRSISRTDPVSDKNLGFIKQKQSPILGFETGHSVDDFPPLSSRTWKRSPSSAEANLVRFNSNASQLTSQDRSSTLSYADLYDAAEIHVATETKPLPMASLNRTLQDKLRSPPNDSNRVSSSPPALGAWSHIPSRETAVLGQASSAKTSSSPAAKRTRSPPLRSAQAVMGNSGSAQDGTEREEQAKAKRLARFKSELEPMSVQSAETQIAKPPVNETLKPKSNKQNLSSTESNRNAFNGEALSKYTNSEQSCIIGLCPDMCPQSEREERERKGDLDRHERVDGDRNQTSKYLAVKKYNRTAEREAILIRPKAVLQKTMDYLLSLLDKTYDENFLRIYNFLWDRMRAIRMDLRMQHIFNQEAITMLEHMIRLHIVAMHELCEYTKGEGFSEGFDAHLNIEQMNKTSVDLFQMYDDHRKKGINIPTEKEFRGYYALLKLDKHPGYKVEPAELSLELAKMTPEIRQTSEVLFARDVARACRAGNYIAFFRLARKASYLQACLMHAHFAKLRTQALASLHSGFLNNQGLPISDVSKWIGMEEEDIESLLEYHGFSIKEFEEPYMMKSGPFLHDDTDYPTTCSKLVHLKKSSTIVEDVSVPSSSIASPTISAREYRPSITTYNQPLPDQTRKKQSSHIPVKVTRPLPASLPVVDEEKTKSKNSILQEEPKPIAPVFIKPKVDQHKQDSFVAAGGFVSPWKLTSSQAAPIFPRVEFRNLEKQSPDSQNDVLYGENVNFSIAEAAPMNVMSGSAMLQSSLNSIPREIAPIPYISVPPSPIEDKHPLEDSLPETGVVSDSEEELYDIDEDNKNENGLVTNLYDEEVAKAKLKLMLRLWKRWSLRQRESRERRQLSAMAALSSLSLGPTIRFGKSHVQQLRTPGELNIDEAMMKRFKKQEQSMSALNISDVIADILAERNPDSKCVCWKVSLYTQMKSANTASSMDHVTYSAASQWLLSKLIPRKEDSLKVDHLLFSSAGVSIWNKWVSSGLDSDLTCCLSVARAIEAESDLHKASCGSSAVIFLVTLSIPWNLQREQLNIILNSVSPGSCLPLLILIGSCNGESTNEVSDVVSQLGLHGMDKSRISSFSVVFLSKKAKIGQEGQFFSNKRLRDGLKWLASNSPLQPSLYRVKPREFALAHLSLTLELLKKIPDHEVTPNLCISAFNDTLDQSQGNITSAAEANVSGWPCPEIELLEEWQREHLIQKQCLPIPGWNSTKSIGLLKSTFDNCKLPSLCDDLTWLSLGCASSAEVEYQTQRLESCLVEYLTQTQNLMGTTLAVKEAGVMLQRNTRLELYDLSYRIIPRWVGIFQRIFNWRLMGLMDPSCSSAYVLKSDMPMSGSSYVAADEILLSQLSSVDNLPLLDEMIELSCVPIKSASMNKSLNTCEAAEVSRRLFESPGKDHGAVVPFIDHEARDQTEKRGEALGRVDNMMMMIIGDELSSSSAAAAEANEVCEANRKVEKPLTEDERFGELLNKCNMVQNTIAEKLSIYF